MKVREYILPGKKQRQEIQLAVEASIAQWLRTWSLDHAGVGVEKIDLIDKLYEGIDAKPAIGIIDDKILFQFKDGDSVIRAILQLDRKMAIRLAGHLFQHNMQNSDFHRDGLLRDILAELFLDWVKDLSCKHELSVAFEKSRGLKDILPDSWQLQGSGAIYIQLSLDSTNLLLVLLWEDVKHLLSQNSHRVKPAQPLSDLASALEAEVLHTDVMLGEIELTVEALVSLKQGDVLCLDATLQDPVSLQLSSAGRGYCLSGFLGKQGEKRAVQVESVKRVL